MANLSYKHEEVKKLLITIEELESQKVAEEAQSNKQVSESIKDTPRSVKQSTLCFQEVEI